MTPLARTCRCDRPLRDGETCLRCGRAVAQLSQVSLTPSARRRRRKQTWTRAGVIRAIRAFAFFRGRAPVPEDWKGRMGDEWPSLATVEALFGSVSAAVRAAGVEGQSPPSDAVGA
jgi:hypothetical protein